MRGYRGKETFIYKKKKKTRYRMDKQRKRASNMSVEKEESYR